MSALSDARFLIGSLAVLVVFGMGCIVAIVVAGGTDEQIIARVGLLTAFAAGPVGTIVALLMASHASSQAQEVRTKVNGVEARVNGVEQHLGIEEPAPDGQA